MLNALFAHLPTSSETALDAPSRPAPQGDPEPFADFLGAALVHSSAAVPETAGTMQAPEASAAVAAEHLTPEAIEVPAPLREQALDRAVLTERAEQPAAAPELESAGTAISRIAEGAGDALSPPATEPTSEVAGEPPLSLRPGATEIDSRPVDRQPAPAEMAAVGLEAARPGTPEGAVERAQLPPESVVSAATEQPLPPSSDAAGSVSTAAVLPGFIVAEPVAEDTRTPREDGDAAPQTDRVPLREAQPAASVRNIDPVATNSALAAPGSPAAAASAPPSAGALVDDSMTSSSDPAPKATESGSTVSVETRRVTPDGRRTSLPPPLRVPETARNANTDPAAATAPQVLERSLEALAGRISTVSAQPSTQAPMPVSGDARNGLLQAAWRERLQTRGAEERTGSVPSATAAAPAPGGRVGSDVAGSYAAVPQPAGAARLDPVDALSARLEPAPAAVAVGERNAAIAEVEMLTEAQRSERGEPAGDSSRLDLTRPAQIAERLARALQPHAEVPRSDGAQHSLRLALAPASLGDMNVQFDQNERGEVSIRITTTSAVTREVLEPHLSRVRSNLEELGIRLGTIDVQVAQQDTRQPQQQSPGQDRDSATAQAGAEGTAQRNEHPAGEADLTPAPAPLNRLLDTFA